MATGVVGTRWTAFLELLVIAALIESYLWWIGLDVPWFAAVIVALCAISNRLHRESFLDLGFGWTAFRRSFLPVFLLALVFVASGLALALEYGTVRHITVATGLLELGNYFWWGLVQQYVLNGIFVNRLRLIVGPRRVHAACGLAAVLFTAAHLPNWFLMAIALPLGFVATELYVRYRSLYSLALAHGALGALIFSAVPFWVSHRLQVGLSYYR